MVTFIQLPKKGPSKSEQLAQGISRAAAGTAQHLYQQEQMKKQNEYQQQEQKNIADFMEREYGVKGSENLPQQFQMEVLKGSQSQRNKLAGQPSEHEKRNRNDIVARSLRGEATPEEEATLPAEDQLKISKEKRESAKEPAKTQASKPIDPDQLDRMQKVRDNPRYQKVQPTEKYRMLTDAGVSRENAKAEVDIELEQYKGSKEDEERAARIKYDYHKESKDYDEDMSHKYKAAKREYETIKSLEKKVGNVSPKSISSVLRGFGTVGDKLADAFMSKDQATIQAAIPEFLEGKKEIFGVRLTDADLRVVEDKIVNIGKSPEANRALLKIGKKYAEQSILKGKIARQVKQENGNLRPLGYDDIVEERFEAMVEPVTMVTDRGQEVEVPAYQVSGAISNGWTMSK